MATRLLSTTTAVVALSTTCVLGVGASSVGASADPASAGPRGDNKVIATLSPRPAHPRGDARSMTWSADQCWVGWSDWAGQYLYSVASGRTTRIDRWGGHRPTPSLSRDGRFVAYSTQTTGLVPDDRNGEADVFLWDRARHTRTLVSRGLGGGTADDMSNGPVITPDGRFVAFQSKAGDLVRGDHNDNYDAFVWDRRSHRIEMVDRTAAGKVPRSGSVRSLGISDDGRYVVFSSLDRDISPLHPPGLERVYLRDMVRHRTVMVSHDTAGGAPRGGWSNAAQISGDGSTVVFSSGGIDIAAGTSGGDGQVAYLWNRLTDTNHRISTVDDNGVAEPIGVAGTVSRDGGRVALIGATLWSRTERTAFEIDRTPTHEPPDSQAGWTVVSPDGTQALYWSSATDVVAGTLTAEQRLYLWTEEGEHPDRHCDEASRR